jgi:hypothetical protein
MSTETFSKLTKTEMVDFLFDTFAVPKGSARGMNREHLIEKYDECVCNDEVHAAIARQASKPR